MTDNVYSRSLSCGLIWHRPVMHLTCYICGLAVELEVAKTNEDGEAVHEECYVEGIRVKAMQKPGLLLLLSPSGDPLLRGCCSACSDVRFAFVGNSEENCRLMQEAFDRHFEAKHAPLVKPSL